MPEYYKFDEQMKRVVAFLQNNVFYVDIFAVEPDAPAGTEAGLIAPLGKDPFTLNAGQHVTVSVVIHNKGSAHSRVPEQRDMYEPWVAFTVKNAQGKTLSESGFIQPGGKLDSDAHSFMNRLINKNGGITHGRSDPGPRRLPPR